MNTCRPNLIGTARRGVTADRRLSLSMYKATHKCARERPDLTSANKITTRDLTRRLMGCKLIQPRSECAAADLQQQQQQQPCPPVKYSGNDAGQLPTSIEHMYNAARDR